MDNNIIIKYLQGVASEEEKKKLLGWIRANDENKKMFLETQDIWIKTDFASSPIYKLDYVKKSFRNFVQKIEILERDKRRVLIKSYLRVAASIIILISCLSGSYILGHKGFLTDVEEVQSTVLNHVIMGKDSKGSITLPDGTLVWMNSNSKLIYPENFSSDERYVKQEGECYFEVAKNEKIPFYVETSGMKVKVLGTKFNVKNYSNKNSFETTLVSGKVEVLFPESGEEVTLEPSQKISKAKGSGKIILSEVDALEHIIWINEKLILDNESLSTIIRKMKYWYNIDFIIGTGVDLNQRLSLTIRKESPEEIFKLLELICPIKHRIEGDVIYVNSK